MERERDRRLRQRENEVLLLGRLRMWKQLGEEKDDETYFMNKINNIKEQKQQIKIIAKSCNCGRIV